MTIYTCPMHPEIRQDKAGNCSKCGGMKLVPLDSLKDNVFSQNTENENVISSTWKNYVPLAVIIGLISLTTVILSLRDLQHGNFTITTTISYFMIGFFLVFAGFKLIGLKGFAEGYSSYDLLARRIFAYGYVYPFIELFFGLAMMLDPTSKPLLLVEILVMGFSGIGVSIKLMKKEKFQCVCLGTILKVPLTKITVIEDLGMVGLALVMLMFSK